MFEDNCEAEPRSLESLAEPRVGILGLARELPKRGADIRLPLGRANGHSRRPTTAGLGRAVSGRAPLRLHRVRIDWCVSAHAPLTSRVDAIFRLTPIT